MPYTPEELNKLQFYQDLITRDEEYYLLRKGQLMREALELGAANEGNLLIRDKDGFVLLFENPYQNEIPEDDETKMIHNTDVKKLKVSLDYGSTLDEVIDREFEEII